MQRRSAHAVVAPRSRGDHGSLDDFREAALHPRRARRGRARRCVVAPCRKVVPMTFRFRKLYADVVSDDGTVTIVYLTWLELWGARFASAGVERYGSDGCPGVRSEERRAG